MRAPIDRGINYIDTADAYGSGRGETVLAPRLYKGAEEHVAIAPRGDVYVTVARGDAAPLEPLYDSGPRCGG